MGQDCSTDWPRCGRGGEQIPTDGSDATLFEILNRDDAKTLAMCLEQNTFTVVSAALSEAHGLVLVRTQCPSSSVGPTTLHPSIPASLLVPRITAGACITASAGASP